MNSLLAALLVTSTPSFLVKIDGEGWMRFSRDGRTVFAKQARLTSVGGRLGAGDATILPVIPVSSNLSALQVSPDGTVLVNGVRAGQLVVALFGPTSPLSESNGFWTSPDRPKLEQAGQNGAGKFLMAGSATPPPVQTPRPQPNPTAVLSAGAEASKLSVRVMPDSMVATNTFTLGDIAEVAGPTTAVSALKNVLIGDTPPIGLTRKVDRERILVRLRVSGFDPATIQLEVPATAQVRRPSQMIEHSRFYDVAVAALKPVVGASTEVVDLNPAPPMILGIGDLTLTAKTPSLNGKQATVTVEVRLNGEKVNSRTLQFSLAGSIPLPKVGTMVTVRAKANGVRVNMTARVTGTNGLNSVDVVTTEGAKLSGTLVEPGVVEVTL